MFQTTRHLGKFLVLSVFVTTLTFAKGSEAQSERALIRSRKVAAATGANNPALKNRYLAKFDLAAISDLRNGKHIKVNLPNKSFRFKAKSKRDEGKGIEVYSGTSTTEAADGIITLQGGVLKAATFTLHKQNRSFSILDAGNGRYLIDEYDASKFPGCATDHSHSPAVSANDVASGEVAQSTTSVAADGNVTIDVLVMWTPEARAAAGGTAAIQSLVQQAISVSNQAYVNSGVMQQLNLVYSGETAQSEVADYTQNLYNFTNKGDSYFDEVHSARDAYGADLNVLLVNGGQYCGVAWLMQNVSTSFASNGFAVVSHNCAVGNLTFAHELGHNMGAEHNIEDATQGAYSYSYGYRFVGTNGVGYRTVMAYNGTPSSTRVAHFSNPEVAYAGTATGTSSANNALTLNNTATTVAAFRSPAPTVCTAAAPTVTISPSLQSGAGGVTKSYTVTVTNNDSGPCAASNFNLALTLPGGWSGSLNSGTLQLGVSASGSTSFSATPPLSATGGDYQLAVGVSDSAAAIHSRTASARYVIDTVAPSAPSNLKAAAGKGKRGGVITSWTAATDNVGVTGYLVYRDGVQIGQTTSLSYTDKQVTSGRSYTYTVRARDIAGNISASSNSVAFTVR